MPGLRAPVPHSGRPESPHQVWDPSAKSLLNRNWAPREEGIDTAVEKGSVFSRVVPLYTQAAQACVSLY